MKLTQDELADKLGISRAALSHYEMGRNEMNYDLLIRVAEFFDVSVDVLLDRESESDLFDNARVARPEILDIYDRLSRSAQDRLLHFARGMISGQEQ